MSTATKRRKVKAEIIDCAEDACESFKQWWLLPRTAADYDAMLLQIARALERNDWQATYEKDARAALRAIGITRPKENKR